jgi:hypothetical protein
VLPVFRKAGDFRCIARTLHELARLQMTDDPAAVTGLLLESLHAAAIASSPAMHARILTDLITAAASTGDLALAARCAGALEAVGTQVPHVAADRASTLPASSVLKATLRGPTYATFIEEGRAGGIDLLTTLYPRQDGTGPVPI